jgi:hypothetical protein
MIRKIFLFGLFYLFFIVKNFAICFWSPKFVQINECPLIVYATVKSSGSNSLTAPATVHIHKVIKGYILEDIILNAQIYDRDIVRKRNATGIYFLYYSKGKWYLSISNCGISFIKIKRNKVENYKKGIEMFLATQSSLYTLFMTNKKASVETYNNKIYKELVEELRLSPEYYRSSWILNK